MTLEYKCSNCGALLQTTNADPLDIQMRELEHEILLLRGALKTIQRTASCVQSPLLAHINETISGIMPQTELTKMTKVRMSIESIEDRNVLHRNVTD